MWFTKATRGILALIFSSALLIQGCATPYQGPGPDFDVSGTRIPAEIEKYTLDESVPWLSLEPALAMGPEKTRYRASTLTSVVENVSSDAARDLRAARKWRIGQFVALGATAVLLGSAMFLADQGSQPQNGLYAASVLGVGVSVSLGFVWANLLSSTASQYNHDLENRFRPKPTSFSP